MRGLGRRLFAFACLTSLLLCVLLTVLWASTWTDARGVFRTAWEGQSENGPEGARTHWLGSDAGRVYLHYRQEVFKHLGLPDDVDHGGAVYGFTQFDPRTDPHTVGPHWRRAEIEFASGP